MRSGNTVRPKKWTNIIDLYDDDEYSAVWGNYDNNTPRCLGVRWNGDPGDPNDIGFPRQGDNPLWYVEHSFLTKMILLELFWQVTKTPSSGNIGNIQTALNECP